MGLLNSIKQAISGKHFEDIGNVEPVCPNCGKAIESKPSRKKKCPECGKFMFVRTRPSDNKKVLVTEAQAEVIEEQWSINNGTHEAYLSEKKAFENEKASQTTRFGCVPSDNDVKWGLLNKQLTEQALSGDWGFYRNTKFQMAEILRKEEKLKSALYFYLDVFYLDLNGPNNMGGASPELLKKFPPFRPNEAMIAPGIIKRILSTIKKLGVDSKETENLFKNMAKEQYSFIELPISIEKAWEAIETRL
jgi:DNA-directed RNA polymerase subunit RPC12/RpoP